MSISFPQPNVHEQIFAGLSLFFFYFIHVPNRSRSYTLALVLQPGLKRRKAVMFSRISFISVEYIIMFFVGRCYVWVCGFVVQVHPPPQIDCDCSFCLSCLCRQGLVSSVQVRRLECPLSFIAADRGPHYTLHWLSDRQAGSGCSSVSLGACTGF